MAALTACAGHVRGDERPGAKTGRVEVLLLSGGGTPSDNAYAHKVHLEEMLGVMDRAGIPRDHVTVMASDGADPADDLSLGRQDPDERGWLLDGTRFARLLQPPELLQNTVIDGTPLLPAREAALEAWLHFRGRLLGPGDTLLLYVTDHGLKNPRDPRRNEIVLWGGDKLNVMELRALLARLDPGVRVVTAMSQCYSGGFLHALTLSEGGALRPNSCGVFSTLPTQAAYGCYHAAPGDGLDGFGVGIARSLEPGGNLDGALGQLVLGDHTPDIPHRSSDAWLAERTIAQAKEAKLNVDVVASRTLGDGWADDPRWASARDEVAALAAAYGLEVPKRPLDVGRQSHLLRRAKVEVAAFGREWKERQEAIARQVLGRFVNSDARWAGTTVAGLARALGLSAGPQRIEDTKASLRRTLMERLRPWVDAVPDRRKDLVAAREKARSAEAARYRIDVRLAALERMRVRTLAAAGEVLVADDPEATEAVAALRRCESWRLPGKLSGEAAGLAPAPGYAPLADELAQVELLRPPWVPKPREKLEAGVEAPSLDGLIYYRGEAPAAERRQLLFFWATWCKPCKAALPELMALAARHDLDIVAISNDNEAVLDKFFASWTEPFPVRVARDPKRVIHAAYAATSLPTFVVVEPDGHVFSHFRGMPRNGTLPLKL